MSAWFGFRRGSIALGRRRSRPPGCGVRRRREEGGKTTRCRSHLETLPHDLRRQRLPLGFLRGRRARGVSLRSFAGSERGWTLGRRARRGRRSLQPPPRMLRRQPTARIHVWARTVGSSAECSCGALMLMSTSVSVAATHRGRPPLIVRSPVSVGLARGPPPARPSSGVSHASLPSRVSKRSRSSRSPSPILIDGSTRFSRSIRGFRPRVLIGGRGRPGACCISARASSIS